MSFVVDASMTMAWCFPDEATSATRALLRQLRQSSAYAPAIWILEVTNILLIAERRQRTSQQQTARFTRLLRALPIMIEADSVTTAFGSVLPLARMHNLSSYDAAYLDLAMRHGLPLATLDARLRTAAIHAGVTIL